jgi:predicted transcriptional regulator
MPAEPIVRAKEVRDDGSVVELVVWRVPERLPPCTHFYKYRLYFRIVKAVIEIAPAGSVFKTARKQLRAGEAGARGGADLHLSFESARGLFAELSPARLDLLESLRRLGPCSVYALAKEAQRNYSNVHADIAKLEEHGLVARTEEDAVFVPFDAVEIHLALLKKAA